MKESGGRRNAGIDILRGLSILIVVCHHISLRVPIRHTVFADFLPAPVIRILGRGGGDAVTMFFVLSGFLIATRCHERFGDLRSISPWVFLRHRAARILPCLLVLLAVLSVLAAVGPDWFRFRQPGQSVGGAVFSVLTCSFNWFEGRTTWAPANWDVLWSLSIEEAFYLAFPWICLMPSRVRMIFLGALIIFGPIDDILLRGANEIWREKAYFPGFGSIATGVAAALLARRLTLSVRMCRGFLVLGAVMALLELGDDGVIWRHLGVWVVWLLTFGVALMLLGLDGLGRAGRRTAPTAGTHWIQGCGRLSYEIYLTHMFIVMPAVILFGKFGGTADRAGWLVYGLVLPMAWLLGAGVAAIWSRPAAQWLDRRAGKQRGSALSPV